VYVVFYLNYFFVNSGGAYITKKQTIAKENSACGVRVVFWD